MLVLNEIGREMNVSIEDYRRLVSNGLKLTVIKGEKTSSKNDSVLYTATCGYKIKRNDIKCFKGDKIFSNPVMEAKRYKVLPHLFFDNEITIWIDGNIFLKPENDYVIDRFLGDADIAIFNHPFRDNIWEEFDALKEQERFQIPWLQKQLKSQRKAYSSKLPKETGLWECNFIIRRNNERVNRLNESWWAEICRWQWRDQVSFPYVLHKHPEVKMRTIEEGNIRNHKLFKYVQH